MPQIMCPNCGRTITLENRRKVDFDLIVTAVRKEPRKFTDLLKITKLSRKTLSLRLKEMCETAILLKREGKYLLNGAPHQLTNTGKAKGILSTRLSDRRIRLGLSLIALMVLSSASGYGLATFLERPTPLKQTHTTLGNFTMSLDINGVEDLYAWQAVIVYNSTQLEVLEIIPGGFLGAQFFSENMTDLSKGVFENKTLSNEGTLLLGGAQIGHVPGTNGSGRLAIITFGYLIENYEEPKLNMTASDFDTLLLNHLLSDIPISNSTLTLSVIENH